MNQKSVIRTVVREVGRTLKDRVSPDVEKAIVESLETRLFGMTHSDRVRVEAYWFLREIEDAVQEAVAVMGEPD